MPVALTARNWGEKRHFISLANRGRSLSRFAIYPNLAMRNHSNKCFPEVLGGSVDCLTHGGCRAHPRFGAGSLTSLGKKQYRGHFPTLAVLRRNTWGVERPARTIQERRFPPLLTNFPRLCSSPMATFAAPLTTNCSPTHNERFERVDEEPSKSALHCGPRLLHWGSWLTTQQKTDSSPTKWVVTSRFGLRYWPFAMD